jgi:hypothetical protein
MPAGFVIGIGRGFRRNAPPEKPGLAKQPKWRINDGISAGIQTSRKHQLVVLHIFA